MRRAVPSLAAFAVAATCAWALAVHDAPRPDELHTLAHVADGSLAELWRSYRSATDATPPFAYVFSWGFGRVLGQSLVAVRLPYVLCWGAAAAVLAALTRRAGGWAALVAGLVPTATALVYLGSYARPYAPTLAALALALSCWVRADTAERPTAWLVGLAVSAVVATALHYTSIVALGVLGIVPFVLARGVPPRPGRAIVALVAGPLTVLAGALVLRQALDAQNTLARSVSPLDPIRFWPNTLRPAAPLWALVLLVVVAGVAWDAWRRRRASSAPAAGPEPVASVGAGGSVLPVDLLAAGVGLAVVVPVGAVLGMMATSGVYFHRYALGTLIGLSVLVAEGVARAQRTASAAGPLVALLLVAGAGLATVRTADEHVSVGHAELLSTRLGLGREAVTFGLDPLQVVVLDEYDFHLLRRYPTAEMDAGSVRLRLGAPDPGVVSSPHPVDLDAWFARRGPIYFDVIGDPGELDALLAAYPGWVVTEEGTASYVRPGSPRVLVRRRFEWTGP